MNSKRSGTTQPLSDHEILRKVPAELYRLNPEMWDRLRREAQVRLNTAGRRADATTSDGKFVSKKQRWLFEIAESKERALAYTAEMASKASDRSWIEPAPPDGCPFAPGRFRFRTR